MEKFVEYNRRDVEVELKIQRLLSEMPVPDFIWEEFYIDQRINDRGILVDTGFAEKAVELDSNVKKELFPKLKELTGLDNPNSPEQMKDWLMCQGIEVDSLDKKSMPILLESVPDDVREVLTLYQQLSKSSVSKYHTMLGASCEDGRARGMFSFYGASRTGRFCIAESAMILVKDIHQNVYEKPIQDVQLTDLVFDGENWVKHEGVVFSGEKEVIEWDGIIATPEHQVFIDGNTKISLIEAKEMKLQLWTGKHI